MAKTARVQVQLSLTSDIYRRSAPEEEKPHLCVASTLLHPSLATFELIGEFDTGTVLEDRFRMQHFIIRDTKTGEEIINKDPFPGTCDPHCVLYLDSVLELHESNTSIVRRLLEDIDPGGDPVRDLLVGHEYSIKLRPQRILCYDRSIADLFGENDPISRDELLPTAIEVVLASDDEVFLRIEA